ncbi:UNVERIFIED_CONTAM: hypothetical protein FKN15_061537 [Acipenser sinensis]
MGIGAGLVSLVTVVKLDEEEVKVVVEEPAEPEKVSVAEKEEGGAADKKVVKIASTTSPDEKLQQRAQRFNVPPTGESKKAARAARFGLPAAPEKALMLKCLGCIQGSRCMLPAVCNGGDCAPDVELGRGHHVGTSQAAVQHLASFLIVYGQAQSQTCKRILYTGVALQDPLLLESRRVFCFHSTSIT